MPRRTLWLIFGVSVFSLICYERADHNPYGRWFSEVLETIDRHYVEPVDEQKLFEGALHGMVGKLDDYSDYLPRSEAPRFQEALDQHYGGIGIEIDPKNALTVMNPLIGTPAYKAGIAAGDKIVAVDGKSTENIDLVKLLRGKPGSEVTVSVVREGHKEPLVFKLVRARIKVDSVVGDVRNSDGTWNFFLPGDERIGYLRVNGFGESTSSEFEAALAWLTERKCRGVILDMRNNPGGLVDSAKEICDLFVPADSLIVTTRGRDGRTEREYRAGGNGRYLDLPVVVLVNDKSASASEIVAACLQDHNRATVVGERTWGKGTVQNVIPLEGGKSLLKLTIASYWRPNGKNIHRFSTSEADDEWGVKPDPGCEVKLDEKQFLELVEKRRQRDQLRPASLATEAAAASPAEFDDQLKRAVEVLERKIAGSVKPKAA